MLSKHLIDKYNVAAPRYTSYPTVPYWSKDAFNKQLWSEHVRSAFEISNKKDGISLYIHLPFCESLCTYCGCNTRITKNHAVEEPYIDALLKEWSMYCDIFEDKPIIREIHLGGGTPTFFSPANLTHLIKSILMNADVHPEADFGFEGHPANTTYEHLKDLYNLGFRRLSLGIQDFDPKVQFIINRIQTFEQVRDVTDWARQIGYTSVNYDLIYGLPLQTLGTLVDTVEKVSKLMPDRIAFYSYAHVPWIKPGQRRFTEKHLPSPDEKRALYGLGHSMLTAMGYYDIGMDHFALPVDTLYIAERKKKLHRNFMGYTHQYTRLLVGLGVSSISDTWDAYAQNVKTVEEYIEMTNNNELPVVKGHFLSAEDIIIRKHILNIMCKGETEWNHHTEPCYSLMEGLQRMQDLADDGLVELGSYYLSVTPTGKRFLRNICMAIDARLWADQPSTQLFSMAG
ncbi:oxygen-independent coproporphyrinogen III oxidase [Mucilaginibacter sp. BT774]|uniref:oxygen-independent coproporphyrinogen III oxidase n=1 Tax=Mucilaginibacter sp. BT774 TaxID=3062276 RepID=UPI002675C3DA|nr:oxygen-independent coproporphyrinogen III oxidase [Mucilaginibacter sp. BT774]MDO3627290.1 oxygen-independent coproporphyrinogen III oxidase [Mucilaginibacter sp. BT774]